MRAKLGLTDSHADDEAMINELLEMMQQSSVDFTNLFRSLSRFKPHIVESNHFLRDQFIDRGRFDQWAKLYAHRLVTEGRDGSECKQAMDAVNPKYVLRNHLVQRAIELAESGNYSEIQRLHEILNRPYSDQTLPSYYATPPAVGSERVVVSCSS
jgi:uncharacterized protein YdiU (UPF0061 family)